MRHFSALGLLFPRVHKLEKLLKLIEFLKVPQYVSNSSCEGSGNIDVYQTPTHHDPFDICGQV